MAGSAAPIPWRHLFHTIRRFMPLWAGATIVFTMAGSTYTNIRKSKFSANQSLLVRNEANGEEDRLGRFASQTDLKAAQETILELASSRDVVHASLTRLGEPVDADATPRSDPWPSVEDIDSWRKLINVRPPKGSQFGATEVIYLETKEESRDRARRLCDYVREELTKTMRMLRSERSSSVIGELTEARNLARTRRDEAFQKLNAIETSVGSDLSELRALTETYAGSGNSQRVLAEVQKEQQQAELELDKLRELEKVLKQGQDSPDQLIVTGSELLKSQPTLARLKAGFIDAQLRSSQLSSLYPVDHPKMRASEASQLEILQKIRLEIVASIESMAPQIRVAQDKVARLKAKQEKLSQRMDELAEIRTKYSNLVADFKHRTDLLKKSEATLSEAEATRQAAISTDLLTPLGPIQVGNKPVGPSNLMLVLGSIAAGLLCGFGLVFLVAPGPDQENFGRRWSDYSGSNVRQPQPQPQSTETPTTPAKVTESAVKQEVVSTEQPHRTAEKSDIAKDARTNLLALAGEISREEAEQKLVDRRRNPRS